MGLRYKWLVRDMLLCRPIEGDAAAYAGQSLCLRITPPPCSAVLIAVQVGGDVARKGKSVCEWGL